jgi:hypothetical protein
MSLNYGLKISTPNNDTSTQTDDLLAFTSKYPSLKLIKSGDIQVTTDGSGNGVAYVTHSLGFAPAYFAFQKRTVQWTTLDASSYNNGYVPDPGMGNQWGGDYHHLLHVYTDSTKIYLEAKGAAASTTYTVHYLLFADLAEDYSGSDISSNNNYGFKVSRDGIDVRNAKQYQLGYSSRYKSIQYYGVSYKTTTLTLPIMFASPVDSPQEEGTYVDIAHGLGYPPFFLAFYKRDVGDPISFAIPHLGVNPTTDALDYGVSGFCDATRVRISFWRKSTYGVALETWPAETITLKVYIFTEDLSGSFNAL